MSREVVADDEDTATEDTTSADPAFEPYDEVITDEAETDEGMFDVHRIDAEYFYEIPDSLLGEEFLLVSRMARTQNDLGYGGEKANTQVVRWERHEERVFLRVVGYEDVAEEDDPIYEAVRNSNFEPIVRSFDIKALDEDSSAVVLNVTSLYTEDVSILGLPDSYRERFEISSLDDERSYVEYIHSYPENIDVRQVLTYNAGDPPSHSSTETVSLEMHHSMVRLPEDRMARRPCDQRVGYFNVEYTVYGSEEQKAVERCFITRWRLEPSDSSAWAEGELVEPVDPIVYYIDPATPNKWRPYIKRGVEDWNEAFRNAGFEDAIRAKDPPSKSENPEFNPEDVRYSVIRYFASETQNAYGPHVHDPRTGEILESDIGWYHNVMNLLRNWYFVQTAAANPEARATTLDDEVMGRLIRFVAAHEVGHTLGLPHNMAASHAYPVDSLRSASFTTRYGTAPSIMDYARFNYVAQPEDEGVSFLPDVGPYDEYAIRWGYRPLPDATTREAKEAELNDWILEHADDPMYFYGRGDADPRVQTEDLGRNAVTASEYGIENLKRIVPKLVQWTEEQGEDYEELEELYGEVIMQWNRYMGHVAEHLGGVYETHKTYEQEGMVYTVTPPQQQEEAMAFLNEHAFETPEWMLKQDILRRIEASGVLERIQSLQAGVLRTILRPERMQRMIEAEATGENETYTLPTLLEDLREGIWRELTQDQATDPYRRNLQRAYIERFDELLQEDVDEESRPNEHQVQRSDIRAYLRGELRVLDDRIADAISEVDDRVTRLHLEDIRTRIDTILNPTGE